jgi:hypothetical protein
MDPLAMPLDALVSASRKEHKKQKQKNQKKKVGGTIFRFSDPDVVVVRTAS